MQNLEPHKQQKTQIPSLTDTNIPGWIQAVILRLQAETVYPDVYKESRVLQLLHRCDLGENLVLDAETVEVFEPMELPVQPVPAQVHFVNEAAPTAAEMKVFDNLMKIFKHRQDQYRTARKEFDAKSSARAIILESLREHSIFSEAKKRRTAGAIVDLVHTRWIELEASKQTSLSTAMHALRMNEASSVEEFRKEITDAVLALELAGGVVSEKTKIEVLLTGISEVPRFSSFYGAAEAQKDSTMDLLVAQLKRVDGNYQKKSDNTEASGLPVEEKFTKTKGANKRKRVEGSAMCKTCSMRHPGLCYYDPANKRQVPKSWKPSEKVLKRIKTAQANVVTHAAYSAVPHPKGEDPMELDGQRVGGEEHGLVEKFASAIITVSRKTENYHLSSLTIDSGATRNMISDSKFLFPHSKSGRYGREKTVVQTASAPLSGERTGSVYIERDGTLFEIYSL